MELIRIIQGDAWNSSELYRAMHGTHPNYTGRCIELIRIIQGDAWNSFQLYRLMHETSVFFQGDGRNSSEFQVALQGTFRVIL
jgi:hypothetical protein